MIRNGQVLLPDGLFAKASITIEDGYIASVGPGSALEEGDSIDAGGMLVMPGIVDIHGDAFERQLMPRPGVSFAHDLALVETDRQLLANGITTAFHGLTWSFEPGLRGCEAALRFMDEFEAVRPVLGCDTHVHLRFENYNLEACDEVEDWLKTGRIGLLAFNDHMDLMTRKLDSYDKMSGYLHRTGLTREGFIAMLESLRGRAGQVPAAIERLAATARRAGIPMASHDDPSPAVRAWYHALGSRLSEFPLDLATARAARDSGGAIILGAPNALRGKSHDKRLMAREAIDAGLCDVLTSDYFYPALLHGPFALHREGCLDLGQAWQLVSRNPAKAVGLNDRGAIEPGRRADLVLVDEVRSGLPRVLMTIVSGKPAFSAGLAVSCRPRLYRV
ncbi:MAG: alpha-D-ribose 1-methylphosphonate 5-triphosphate diphosphatase [Desulfocurvibacter africanus]